MLLDIFDGKCEGIRLSPAALTIYHTQNALIGRIIGLINVNTFIVNGAVHVIPALFPVLYIIFGVPSVDFWFVPIGIHKV